MNFINTRNLHINDSYANSASKKYLKILKTNTSSLKILSLPPNLYLANLKVNNATINIAHDQIYQEN